MGKINKVQKITKIKEAEKNKIEEPVPTHVLIDTKGETVKVNGIKFSGRIMVPKEYSSVVKRLVEERIKQRRSEKEYKEYPDKRMMMPGRGFR